jgi:hypothetical protein
VISLVRRYRASLSEMAGTSPAMTRRMGSRKYFPANWIGLAVESPSRVHLDSAPERP